KFRDDGERAPDFGLLRFLPDGERLISVGSHSLRLWDRKTGHEIRCFDDSDQPYGPFEVSALSADSKTLAVLKDDGTSKLRVWDIATGQERYTATLKAASFPIGTFSPDGRTLIFGRDDHLCFWDVAGNRVAKEYATEKKPQRAAISADGKSFAWSGDDSI